MLPHSNSQEERHLQLERKSAEAASVIREAGKKNGPILIVTHFDADGISAGSIMLAAVRRLGVSVHLRVIENLSAEVVEQLDSVESILAVFTDIGSGYLGLLKGLHKQLVIADHHQALGDPSPNLLHFNTHLLGFDGSSEVSGASTSYLIARAIDQRNRDLAAMAVVGCLGDQQDKGAGRTLTGLNAEILSDAIASGVVEEAQDLILFGRQTRPVHRAIASTTSPFLPGLSGEEDKCLAILDAAGIPTKVEDRWRTIVDLSKEEKRRLVDKIISHIISLKLSGGIALDLIGSVYTLIREDPWTPLRDAREFATLLNACGRMGKPGLGIALGIGERGAAFEEAQMVYTDYKKSLAKYMNWLTSKTSALREVGNIVIVNGRGVIEENMTGAVSSLVSSSGLFGESKVTVVVASTKNGEAKVSTRATDQLIAKGVNLGRILQTLAPSYGGNGGGHAIAAGATLQEDRIDKFLEEFSRIVNSVLS